MNGRQRQADFTDGAAPRRIPVCIEAVYGVRRWVALLGLLLLACCRLLPADWSGRERIGTYRHPRAQTYRIRRVLVLPIRQQDAAVIPCATAVWLEELQRRQAFEVVACRSEDVKEAPYLVGAVSRRELIRLGKSYLVQGVLVTTIGAYRAFPDQRLNLKTTLFAVWDGRVIWAADGCFSTQERFRLTAPTPADDLARLSPEIFLRAAYRKLLRDLEFDRYP